MTDKTGRNDPCPCGSGKKYKACCMQNKKPTFSMGQRKFTAKVITKTDPASDPQTPRTPGNIKPPDYTALMERSFGNAIFDNDQPPAPSNPNEFIAKGE